MKSVSRVFVHALAVAAEHMLGEDTLQRARRPQAEEGMDAERLRASPEVARGAERVGRNERPSLGPPESGLAPGAEPDDREELQRRVCDGIGNAVVRDAELLRNLRAVTPVPIEQLNHAAGRTELERAPLRPRPRDRIDEPDPALGDERVRCPRDRFVRDPPERELQLVAEAHEALVAQLTRER